jgi:hypothetical protein
VSRAAPINTDMQKSPRVILAANKTEMVEVSQLNDLGYVETMITQDIIDAGRSRGIER